LNLRNIACLAATLILVGCSSSDRPPGACLEYLSLVSHKKLNNNSALTVDLVVCYEKDLCERIKKMTSSEYFSSIDQIRQDNTSFLKIFRWEIVPTQILEDYNPLYPSSEDVWGIVVFADYADEGNHRFVVPPESQSTRVILGSEKIEAVENQDQSDYISQKTLKVYPADETIMLNLPSSDSPT
jgi:hypothetical protein